VFLFDHLFRTAATHDRPALELTAMLGAVAAETDRITIGSLVARATLRPPAVLAHALETAQRVAGGRIVAGLGAGDSLSRTENEEYGQPFGTLDERLAALERSVLAVRDRGLPVWVGGTHHRLLPLVALADGWNQWGTDPASFRAHAERLAVMAPDAVRTWGGLVVLRDDDDDATVAATRLGAGPGTIVGAPATVARELHRYVAAGASWLILGRSTRPIP
jgi:alkanesulfonate monooxygenase SsuD/methylene tetrahydromethanopterin reductase-like flavin-dependent oxidoreductase (luciferase family)